MPPTTNVLVRTRNDLHAVAEQVLAGALHRATGRIGLRRTPGGFGTPPFAGPDGLRRIRVDGTDLVVGTVAGERRAPLTTVAAAAELVGVAPGGPDDVYPPATAVQPDRPLAVDPDAAAVLAAFFATVDRALGLLLAGGGAGTAGPPEPVQLWPEHFDLATTISKVNVGGSPGDEQHAEPYFYVGPWDRADLTGPFWNEPFGASRPAGGQPAVADVVAWYQEGLGHTAHRGPSP